VFNPEALGGQVMDGLGMTSHFMIDLILAEIIPDAM